MESVKALLSIVYPEGEIDEITNQIDEILNKYRSEITRSRAFNETDVCLITYGDQVKGESENPLKTLEKFLEKKLPEISTVHILPFYPYSSDDGFSVIDYYQVDPNLGDWSDIESLAASKKLMFDGVINHISQESDWFKGFLGGDPGFESYFIERDPSLDLSMVTRPRTSPLLHDFTDHQGNSKHVWTTFSRDQVDLNYENPKVLLHIIDVLCFYLSKGASVLRLDAVGFLWKVDGTTCIHLEETHAVIKLIRVVLQQLNPEITIITETNVPHKENISYFGNGEDEAHMVYNFTLPPLMAFSLLNQSTEKLKSWATSLQLPGNNVCFFNFGASHDGIGVRPVDGILTKEELSTLVDAAKSNGGLVSFKKNSDGTSSPYEINCNYFSLLKGEDGLGVKRFMMSQAIILTMPGLPALYFHSIVGSENYEAGVALTGHNRTINREKLNYNSLAEELGAEGTSRNEIFNRVKNLITIRSGQPAFHPFGAFEFPEFGEGVFAIRRWHKEDEVLCLYNLTLTSKQVNNLGLAEDLIENCTYDGSLELLPLQFCWLKLKK